MRSLELRDNPVVLEKRNTQKKNKYFIYVCIHAVTVFSSLSPMSVCLRRVSVCESSCIFFFHVMRRVFIFRVFKKKRIREYFIYAAFLTELIVISKAAAVCGACHTASLACHTRFIVKLYRACFLFIFYCFYSSDIRFRNAISLASTEMSFFIRTNFCNFLCPIVSSISSSAHPSSSQCGSTDTRLESCIQLIVIASQVFSTMSGTEQGK